MPKIVKIITATICIVMGLAGVALIWVKDNSQRPEYCALCHNGSMDVYYSSWQSSDYLANAHAKSAIPCQRCHPRTLGESLTEILHFATGQYQAPLPQQAHSNKECFQCHGSYEETIQRTSALATNPHDSHLIGDELDCTTCHKMHEPSQDYCAQCHKAAEPRPGWTTEVASITELGLQVFDPNMDCTVCHSMVPYFDSLKDTNLEAYAHAQAGLECLDCHEAEGLAQVHEQAVPGAFIQPKSFDMSFCFDCHVPNEHTSYQQVRERTADYTIRGENINPHSITVDPTVAGNTVNPHESGQGDIECSNCHKMHTGSRGVDFCYSRCHHERNFESCSSPDCHGSSADSSEDSSED